jgi:predicted nucleotide-binding protein
MPRKKKAALPQIFVASSQESLKYAHAIQKNLDDDADVTVWNQGVFRLSSFGIESLSKVLDKSDFAIFVFAPDDVLQLRKKSYAAVRDNVVFELGLFMGKLGRPRTFMVVPKGSKDLRIPTDLVGITAGVFKPRDNLEAAFGPFCSDVRDESEASIIGLDTRRHT